MNEHNSILTIRFDGTGVGPGKIHDIERLDDLQDEATDLLPRGTPISQSFWKSPTIQELARSQNVQPMANVRTLFGTWPDEENDGFEATIDQLRQPGGETGPRQGF